MEKTIVEDSVRTITTGLKQFKDRIENKTFLITGGAGFLGSWFCDVLNEFNAKIICVDNLSSGSEKNISHLTGNKNFEFVKEDVCNFHTDKKIDYIVHMASIASPPLYQKNPIATLDANIIGIRNLLELAKKNKVVAFLFASTSEVYGNPTDENIPTQESYYGYVNSYGERCMYDEGKRCAEAYCFSYWKKYNLPIRIARIFNTYGPRLDVEGTSQYGRALIKFVSQALENKPITIYGDGKQTRSFCYITDQIEAMFRLLLLPNLDGEVINTGNGNEITILDLAKKIIALTNSKSKLTFNSPPNYNIKDDPRRRCPDTNKLKKSLKFSPNVTLDEGLKKTIEWFKHAE